MTGNPHVLPSTTGLRVVEAVARHASCSGAAAELNMTQSAVSKQLKAVEQVVGTALFLRNRRGLEPTEAGRAFIGPARAVLAGLVSAVAGLAPFRPAQHRVRLHVLPILGDRWLVPRFSRFAELHPEIDVQFTTFVTQETSEAPDAVFRFGEGDWPGQICDYLFGRDVALVGAPDAIARFGGIAGAADVARFPVLDHFQTPLRWSEFGEANGVEGLQPQRVIRFGFYALVIRAAIAGQGLALVPRTLVGEELAGGQLVNPAGLGFRSRHGYWLTYPADRQPSPAFVLLRDWLVAEAAGMREAF
jgi:LysR family transcriptional regulator, glycine cleavage system transcriptional activator